MTRLTDTLCKVRRRDRVLDRRRRAAHAATAWLIALWLVVMFDVGWSVSAAADADPFAVYELSPGVRLTFALLLLIGVAIVAACFSASRRVRNTTDTAYALRCEQAAAQPPGTFVSAVQLAANDHAANDLRAALAERAVRRGDDAAASIEIDRVIDTSPAKRAMRGLIGAAVAFIAITTVSTFAPGPNPVIVGLMRLTMPLADVPPYSPAALNLQVEPAPVAIGDTVTLSAAHDVPHDVPLRIRFGDGTLLPMSADTRSVSLAQVTEPLRVTLEGGHGRSRVIDITPVLLPQVTAIRVVALHTDGRRAALRPPTEHTARVLIGATVAIEVDTNRDDASLDHPDAIHNRLRVTVQPGPNEVALHLTTLDGLRSREPVVLSFEGLAANELAELNDDAPPTDAPRDQTGAGLIAAVDALGASSPSGDAAGAVAAQLQAGKPLDEAVEGDGSSASEQPGDGTGEGSADGDGGSGTGGSSQAVFDESAYDGQLERQLIEQAGLSDEQVATVREAIDRAPRAYRKLTADYFLRIATDANRGSP